jgi:glycerol-1-phosphate dehydrogenase [NAD(P)+]
MNYKQIKIPKFIKIAEDDKQYSFEISDVLKNISVKKIAVITDKKVYDILGNYTENILKKTGFQIKVIFLNSNLISDIEKLVPVLNKYEIIFGVGGGTVIDTSKYIGTKLNVPVISIPTQLSNDGICSPISVLKDSENNTVSIGTNNILGVIVNWNIILNAPSNSVLSGLGDLFGNISAIYDWKLAARYNNEKIDDFALLLSEISTNFLFNIDKLESKTDIIRSLLDGLIASGVAMEVAGSSRPCSGSEHEISHAIDKYCPEYQSYHGIQVAYATLITLALQNNKKFERIKKNYLKIGLPVSLKDLNISKEKFLDVLVNAPSTRPERYTILEHLNYTKADYEKLLLKFELL